MDNNVQAVTTVELCESIILNLQKVPSLRGILNNRKHRIVIDDGRRFLQRDPERYDIILMDPLRTATAYSNNIHSKQFFSLAKRHLNPSGILMVGGIEHNLIIPRTLLEVFSYVRAYPDFSLASDNALGQNETRFDKLLDSFPSEIHSQIREFRKGALEGDSLRLAVSGWEPNDDWHPRSEYFLTLELRRWIQSRM